MDPGWKEPHCEWLGATADLLWCAVVAFISLRKLGCKQVTKSGAQHHICFSLMWIARETTVFTGSVNITANETNSFPNFDGRFVAAEHNRFGGSRFMF